MQRRQFLASLPVAASAASAVVAAEPKLGVDLFSLRSQGWTPFQHLDYCSKLSAKVVHFSEIRFIGSLEDEHVKKVGEHARSLGIELEIGMRSVCPSSRTFDAKAGTAEEQLTKVIRAAGLAQSKLVRAFLGSLEDRKSDGGIEKRIEDAVKVLRSVRSRATDAGIKIAIENHAGDMQGRELKMLIEAAGKDFVGACYDSGNPCWALEDPHVTLDAVAPYVLTSHIRDSYLWSTDDGTAVNWTRMGEGNVDIGGLLTKFIALCPGKAMSLEVIVMGPRVFPWRKSEFWKGYENVPAWNFARFASLAAAGKPQPASPRLAKEEAIAKEREDLEASMRWARQYLHL